MPDFAGPIQAFGLASWLWLIPLFPFLGALINALYCSGLIGRLFVALRVDFSDDDGEAAKSEPAPRAIASVEAVTQIAIGSLVLSALVAVIYAAFLFQRAPEERFLLSHLWQLVRVGQLDVGCDLAFDPLAAVMVLLVTLLGTLICMAASTPGVLDADTRSWRFFACLGALVFFMLVLVLADNFVILLFGWVGVGLTGYGLSGPAFRKANVTATFGKAFIVHKAGEVGLVLGTVLLFWGLGGSWTPDGSYQSDLDPRLTAVSVTPDGLPIPADDPSLRGGAATKGKGFLTVTGLADALVYVDESRTPVLDAAGIPLVTPFRRHELPGGAHSLRVAPDDRFREGGREAKVAFVLEGGVLPNYTVGRIAFGGDREVALAVIGPTLSFRELRDELMLSDAKGGHPLRDRLLAKKLWGSVGVVTLACLLLSFGAWAKSVQVPLHGWLAGALEGPVAATSLLQSVGILMAGGYLVARLSFLFSLSHIASTIVAMLGICTALFGALASALQYDLKRVLAYSTMSQVGLGFVGLGAGAYSAGVLQFATHAIVKTCLLLAAGALLHGMRMIEKEEIARQDLRNMGGLAVAMPRIDWAYRVGCLALTAVPIPLLSGFWPLADVLDGTMTSAVFPPPLATISFGLLLVTAALTSFGMWRSYFLAFVGNARHAKVITGVQNPAAPMGRILVVLTVLAAGSGLVLGASTRFIGGSGSSALEAWLAPVFSSSAPHVSDASFVERCGFVGLGLAFAYAGWALARHRYGKGRLENWVAHEESSFLGRLGASFR